MNQSPSLITPHLANRRHSVVTPRIALIAASWHADIVQRATGAFAETIKQTCPQAQCDLMEVPGVFEIPLQAKLLAQTGDYDVIVAFGFVVDGGIYRHDFVSSAVIDGLMRVQLDTCVPVLSVVLTPHHFHSSQEHHTFFYDHFLVKGREAANACTHILQRWQASLSPVRPIASSQQVPVSSVSEQRPAERAQSEWQGRGMAAEPAAPAVSGAEEEAKPAVWSLRGSQSTALNSSS